VVAVHEDWAADGAGNGLGTLYAYTKARAKAAAAGHDLDALLASGGTVGVYHTAGKGTFGTRALGPISCTLNPSPYSKPCTLHRSPYTLNSTPGTLAPTRSTLNPRLSTLNRQPQTLIP
jgi:hypothetical protein